MCGFVGFISKDKNKTLKELENKDKELGINYDLAVNFQDTDYDILLKIFFMLTSSQSIKSDVCAWDSGF